MKKIITLLFLVTTANCSLERYSMTPEKWVKDSNGRMVHDTLITSVRTYEIEWKNQEEDAKKAIFYEKAVRKDFERQLERLSKTIYHNSLPLIDYNSPSNENKKNLHSSFKKVESYFLSTLEDYQSGFPIPKFDYSYYAERGYEKKSIIARASVSEERFAKFLEIVENDYKRDILKQSFDKDGMEMANQTIKCIIRLSSQLAEIELVREEIKNQSCRI
ncbi:MAG: hypothetical protein EBS06_05655 [Proteobacteria bacterium]|nr:hypothetical protein [Pseudomonadota bacterium]